MNPAGKRPAPRTAENSNAPAIRQTHVHRRETCHGGPMPRRHTDSCAKPPVETYHDPPHTAILENVRAVGGSSRARHQRSKRIARRYVSRCNATGLIHVARAPHLPARRVSASRRTTCAEGKETEDEDSQGLQQDRGDGWGRRARPDAQRLRKHQFREQHRFQELRLHADRVVHARLDAEHEPHRSVRGSEARLLQGCRRQREDPADRPGRS